jgi:benzodiazapine receptor
MIDITDNLQAPKKTTNRQALLKSLLLSLGTGLLSSLLSPEMRVIYENANKPPFAPPGWIFAPVWIILYILMGIAAYRVFIQGSGRPEVRDALFYYGTQLFLNFMWSILFFRFALAGTAFLDLLLMAALILITTVKFYRIDKTAGLLMIPYLIWVVFAGALNASYL